RHEAVDVAQLETRVRDGALNGHARELELRVRRFAPFVVGRLADPDDCRATVHRSPRRPFRLSALATRAASAAPHPVPVPVLVPVHGLWFPHLIDIQSFMVQLHGGGPHTVYVYRCAEYVYGSTRFMVIVRPMVSL